MSNKDFFIKLAKRKNQKVKSKAKKPPVWFFPTNQEKQYDKALYSLVRELKSLIKTVLIPAIPQMIDEVQMKMPHDRQDSFLDTLNSLILFISNSIQSKVNSTILESEHIGVEIARYNKQQSEKLNRSIFGIDIFVDEPWLADQLKLYSVQNAELIKSIPQQELSRVAGDIERGLQQGERFTDIATTLQKSFGITHRRATLIARDQTTKLNASLTRLRQEQIGVDEYIWQTAGDERVRESHRLNDGKKFKWNSPPKKTGHPGNDVNCRCIARPVLDNILGI